METPSANAVAVSQLAKQNPHDLKLSELKRQKSALDVVCTEEDRPAIKTRKDVDGNIIEESTGTNGLATELPGICDNYYDAILAAEQVKKEAEAEILRAQNLIRQYGGPARYYVLHSGRKAVLRDLVHQPEKTIAANKYKAFRFVEVPEIDPEG